jgi:feruloyl esterase
VPIQRSIATILNLECRCHGHWRVSESGQVLLCQGAENAACLTRLQIDALTKIYAGPTDPRTGQQIYPGYEPGTEAKPGAWSAWKLGTSSAQSFFGNSFVGQAVHEHSDWDWRTINFESDVKLAELLQSRSPQLP